MGLTLYSVSDGPPSLAVRMALKLFGLEYKLVEVDFGTGEHLKEDYAKINPQKEIPTLDDNGFLLSESIAILQYLADQYSTSDAVYPREPKNRAVVNHRLAFNIASYYARISEYVMAPIFFAYERTPLGLKKVNIVLSSFNSILEKSNYKYSASGHRLKVEKVGRHAKRPNFLANLAEISDSLTIADLPLVTATLCLEAINFPVDNYSHVTRWYSTFKTEYPQLWSIAEEGMREIRDFDKNPPQLPDLHHPVHPVRT